MASFSIRRVALFARHHYAMQWTKYLSMVLISIGVPALFAIISNDLYVAEAMSALVYMVGSLAMAQRTTYALRSRGSRLHEMVIPVSKSEQWVSMFLNMTVVYPLVCAACMVLAILIASPLAFHLSLGGVIEFALNQWFLDYNIYTVMQGFASIALLLNIIARRHLWLTYIWAFVIMLLVIYISTYIPIDTVRDIASYEATPTVLKCVFYSTPAVLYIISYVAFMRREMKW